MDYFTYANGEAQCERVSLREIAAKVGTPVYIYSKATLHRHTEELLKAFREYPTLLCFAVKANSNHCLLRQIFGSGFGADLVSGGELQRSLLAGVDPQKIVYSGVGKTLGEIESALQAGILSFNVESSFELEDLARTAKKMGCVAPVSLRINPDIDAKTNPKITTGLYTAKFGIIEDEARSLSGEIKVSPYLKLVGLACHIGSQITNIKPLGEAAERMARLASELMDAGHDLQLLNMGGGLGIRYDTETPPELARYAQVLIDAVRPTSLRLVIEPGRVVVGNSGVLLNTVIGLKRTAKKNFVVVDGAMNDLMRPSMYDSYHEILNVKLDSKEKIVADVVGPICETGDIFGRDRRLSEPVAGDLVYIRSCGAYGFSMSSNYNSRPRAAEVLVDGDQFGLIRRRETLDDLWKNEIIET